MGLIGELAQWQVTLVSGEVIDIAAHADTEEDDFYEISAFQEGEPPVELPIAGVPKR